MYDENIWEKFETNSINMEYPKAHLNVCNIVFFP
jgi:hypothetical protein